MTEPRSPADGTTDDELDALIGTALGSERHIDDDGFSARVVERLPPRRVRNRRRTSVLVVSSVLAGAAGVLAWRSGAVFDVATLANPLAALPLVVVVGVALWGALASAES